MPFPIRLSVISSLLLLCLILIIRTVHISFPVTPSAPPCKPSDADHIPLTPTRLRRFQQALQFRTVSEAPGVYDREELWRLGEFLISSYPTVHKLCSWERVNNYSLLYHVAGSNPHIRPYLLMSHLDVVPVTNLNEWEAPPFSGEVKDGFIYGRGTIDDKHGVMGILEAAESLLSSGIKPQRSFFIAFGHDEEVHGHDGAGALAERLKVKWGVTELEFISDEGLPLTEGIVAGVSGPVATVGVVEKGQLLVKLAVDAAPGHSSMPPPESSIGILAAAIVALERHPQPHMLGRGVEAAMLEALAPRVTLPQRLLMANIWLFKPLLAWFLSLKPTTAAVVRTVTSITMVNGGIKANVIPPHAEALVNHRIHPAQTTKDVLAYDRWVINDPRVTLEVVSAMEPHPTAAHRDEDFAWSVMKTSIGQVWPEAAVVPGIMVGNTDTRWYLPFTHNVYRFAPTHMFPGDPQRFHGVNERISEVNYEQVINFYFHLMLNADQVGPNPTHKHSDL